MKISRKKTSDPIPVPAGIYLPAEHTPGAGRGGGRRYQRPVSAISFVSPLLSLVAAAAAAVVAVWDDPISFLECRIRNLRFPFLASKIEQSTIESLSLRFTIYISGEYYGEESFVHEAGIGSGCLNPFLMLLRGRSGRRRMINVFFFVLSQVSHISCCGGGSSRSQRPTIMQQERRRKNRPCFAPTLRIICCSSLLDGDCAMRLSCTTIVVRCCSVSSQLSVFSHSVSKSL